jgi:hypothetical protein
MPLKIRKPTDLEIKLLEILIKKSSLKFINWKDNLMVEPMNDGNMGSLSLFPNGVCQQEKGHIKQISEYQFTDADGVIVSAALYSDESGALCELDIWKTNFEPLIEININGN